MEAAELNDAPFQGGDEDEERQAPPMASPVFEKPTSKLVLRDDGD